MISPGSVPVPGSGIPASLYIHVPFCVRKCLYCDFVSYPYNRNDEKNYLAGLRREMELWTGGVKDSRWTLSTVFVGGGTPTCLSPEGIEEIIILVKRYFCLTGDVEFTVECNPGTVDRAGLETMRRCGVNRLSIGAQACSENTLSTLGRIHNHDQTVKTLEAARAAGFENVNLDLIFGVPGQPVEDWLQCLERIIDLQPEHVAAYCLQLEERTPLHGMVTEGRLEPCPEELQLEMYYAAVDILEKAGWQRYEISNFARPGRECRHNLVYWHNGQYLGLGPAAHSRVENRRIANVERLDKYVAALAEGMPPAQACEELPVEDDIFETVFLGLRLARGLELEQFRRRFGRSLEELYPGIIDDLVKQGWLEIKDGCLRLTRQGLAVANTVMARFAP